jgi:uncharacterized protein YecT (DUF1311 family)
MTAKAYTDFHEADDQARALVQRLSILLDAEGKEELETAQGAWEQYRQAESDLAAGGYRGGSGMPMMWAITARKITEERIEDLLRYVEDREGH